jgi:argininosuccinate synthase
MTRLLTRLEELPTAGRCLFLASGGLDSTFGIQWAAENEVDLHCLHIDVGGGGEQAFERMVDHYGVPGRIVDARRRFAEEFVAPAILVGALYQGVYPLSSSLSRPLMAEIAVEEARSIGADAIVHTSEPHQNSFNRFNISIAQRAPGLDIANPFLDTRIDRLTKRAALERHGFTPPETVHSIDANLWCRVIENGSLDDGANPVPESVFAWSRPRAGRGARTVAIEFEAGLPVAVDGERKGLDAILVELNELAGSFGIGRYNGFEQTPWGAKNHEVREAPAAATLLTAATQLRQVTLPDEALDLLVSLADAWLRAVVRGHWFKVATEALMQAILTLNQHATGTALVELRDGAPFVTAVESANSLAFDSHPADLDSPLTYERLLLAELDLNGAGVSPAWRDALEPQPD